MRKTYHLSIRNKNIRNITDIKAALSLLKEEGGEVIGTSPLMPGLPAGFIILVDEQVADLLDLVEWR